MSVHQKHIETVVIGAGVVGLAIARSLALKGQDVLVLESTQNIGSGISSRNSEVIHAGIYYPSNSLKAKLCVSGKELLYQYASQRGIAHHQCGKMIVATKETEIDDLEDIHANAEANGVHDLQWLSQSETEKLEPALKCKGALLSPSTGIIDSHSLMLSLQGDLEEQGGSCAFLTSLISAAPAQSSITLLVQSQGEEMEFTAEKVVNAAGLGAINAARDIEEFPEHCIPTLRYAKGNYFALTTKNPFSHLIYPVPDKNSLGVHLTIDLGGKARFGPDVEWVDKLDYTVTTKPLNNFYRTIRNYWPNLPENSLAPDYAGIRPKIYWGDKQETDFVIQGEKGHGIAGLINLFGIESPGLTSSLAIAEHVKSML